MSVNFCLNDYISNISPNIKKCKIKNNSESGHSLKELGRLCYKQKTTAATLSSSKNSVQTLQIVLTLNAAAFHLCEER